MTQSYVQLRGVSERNLEYVRKAPRRLQPKEAWLVQNVEQANHQIHQTAVFMHHQPTTLTRTSSIMEPSSIDPTSVTNCLKPVHHSYRNRGLKCQTNLGKFVGGNTHISENQTEYHDSW